MLRRALDLLQPRGFELRGDELIRIDVPTDAKYRIHREWLLIALRTDWYTGTAEHAAGSLLAANYDEFLAGTAELSVVFEPDEHTSLENSRGHGTSSCRSPLSMSPAGWTLSHPGRGRPRRSPVSRRTPTPSRRCRRHGDDFFLDSSGFDDAVPAAVGSSRLVKCSSRSRAAPAFFDAADIDVSQHFAASDDGT